MRVIKRSKWVLALFLCIVLGGCHQNHSLTLDSATKINPQLVKVAAIATIEKMVPQVSVRRRQDLVWNEGFFQMPLYLFDTVKTFSQGETIIGMNDSSQLELEKDSWVVLDPNHLEILPHRPFLRVGKLTAKTRKELWVVTTAALFRLKAKNENEEGVMEVASSPKNGVVAKLLLGTGIYWPSKSLGKYDFDKPQKMVANRVVSLRGEMASENFPADESEIQWPSTKQVTFSEERLSKTTSEKKFTLEFLSPPDFFETADAVVEILGRVNDAEAVVLINGNKIKVSSNLRFSYQVSLNPGANTIVIRGNNEKESQTKSITLIRTK